MRIIPRDLLHRDLYKKYAADHDLVNREEIPGEFEYCVYEVIENYGDSVKTRIIAKTHSADTAAFLVYRDSVMKLIAGCANSDQVMPLELYRDMQKLKAKIKAGAGALQRVGGHIES